MSTLNYLQQEGDLMPTGMSEDIRLSQVCKNLMDVLDSTETDIQPGMEQMKVFLRVRPFTTQEVSNNENQECFLVESQHSVLANAPKESAAYKNFVHGYGKSKQKFTFSRIFNPDTTQGTIFQDVVVDPVHEFLEGQNSLVFTYGTTGSGKTYTIQGIASNIGLVPRTLDVIFSSVLHKDDMSLMPRDFSDIVKLTASEVQQVSRQKEQLLKLANACGEHERKTSPTAVVDDSEEALLSRDPDAKLLMGMLSDTGKREKETTSVSVTSHQGIRFSFWVSFAEIYNEAIYDLLEPVPASVSHANGGAGAGGGFGQFPGGSRKLKRNTLELRTDKKGCIFVKGLRCIPVSSADEAYRIFLVGKRNQAVACTRLNMTSSRSHTVFTIKAVHAVDKANPNFARVSTLTFCDLAGSERTVKSAAHADTTGQRLREAVNINTSLLTLGRCIEYLRFNQNHHANPKLVPYRNSKLTRLFQSFFTGRGRARMIVNINQCAGMFDETLHVLKFSAIAKQVIMAPDPAIDKQLHKNSRRSCYQQLGLRTPKPGERISIAWETPKVARVPSARVTDVLERVVEEMEEDADVTKVGQTPGEATLSSSAMEEEYDTVELLKIIEDLKTQVVEAKREAVLMEGRIRAEVCEEMNQDMIQLENRYEEYMRENEKCMEEAADQRIRLYLKSASKDQSRKRRRIDPDADDFAEVESTSGSSGECQRLTTRIEELEQEVAEQKDAIDYLTQERDQLQLSVTKLDFRCSQQETQHQCTLAGLQRECDETRDALEEAAETFQEKEKRISQLEDRIRQLESDQSATDPRLDQPETRYDDSCVSVHIPGDTSDVRASKKRFFEPVLEQQEMSMFSDSTAGKSTSGERNLTCLREDNQNLMSKMKDLQSKLNEAVRTKTEALDRADKLDHELKDLTMRSRLGVTLTDDSFLRHESELEMDCLKQQTVDLKQQVVDLERRFAEKHDAYTDEKGERERLQKKVSELQNRLLRLDVDQAHLKNRDKEQDGIHQKLQDELALATEKVKALAVEKEVLQKTLEEANIAAIEATESRNQELGAHRQLEDRMVRLDDLRLEDAANISTLREEIERLGHLVGELTEKNRKLIAEKAALTSAEQTTRDELAAKCTELENLNAHLENQTLEVERSDVLMSTSRLEIRSLELKIRDLETRVDATKKEMEEKVERENIVLEDMRSQLSNSQAMVASLEGIVEGLKTELLQTQADALKKEMEEKVERENILEDMRSQLLNSQAMVASLEGIVEGLKTQADASKKEMEEKVERDNILLEDMKSQLSNSKSQVSSLEEIIDDLKTTLCSQRAQADASIQELEGQLADVQSTLSAKTSQLNDYIQRIGELKHQLDATDKRVLDIATETEEKTTVDEGLHEAIRLLLCNSAEEEEQYEYIKCSFIELVYALKDKFLRISSTLLEVKTWLQDAVGSVSDAPVVETVEDQMRLVSTTLTSLGKELSVLKTRQESEMKKMQATIDELLVVKKELGEELTVYVNQVGELEKKSEEWRKEHDKLATEKKTFMRYRAEMKTKEEETEAAKENEEVDDDDDVKLPTRSRSAATRGRKQPTARRTTAASRRKKVDQNDSMESKSSMAESETSNTLNRTRRQTRRQCQQLDEDTLQSDLGDSDDDFVPPSKAKSGSRRKVASAGTKKSGRRVLAPRANTAPYTDFSPILEGKEATGSATKRARRDNYPNSLVNLPATRQSSRRTRSTRAD